MAGDAAGWISRREERGRWGGDEADGRCNDCGCGWRDERGRGMGRKKSDRRGAGVVGLLGLFLDFDLETYVSQKRG